MIDLKKILILLITTIILLILSFKLNGIIECFVMLGCMILLFKMFFSREEIIKNVKSTKNTDKITNENNKRVDIIELGKNETNETFIISDKELNAMCLLCGATGVGKTTTIKSLLKYPFQNNQPIIIIDGKGSTSFIEDIKNQSLKYNRNFKLFSLNNKESLCYNPLEHGGFTELKDKIINIFNWSEEHYKLQAERFLQAVFKFLQDEDVKNATRISSIDLFTLSKFLNYDSIYSVAEATNKDYMIKVLREIQPEAIQGLANRIQSLCESEISNLFKNSDNQIDLLESIQNNDVVFFSLDSLTYSEYSRMIGKLIISDLKTVAPRASILEKKIYTVFDEFNVFASEIVVNLINKSREYGFRNILSIQELADLTIKNDNKLLNQILGNTNVKIVMRQDVTSSCDEFAKSISTQDKYKVTISTEEDENKYKAVLEEEFIFKPREFSRLGIGEAIVFIKSPEFRYDKIKVSRC